MAKSIMRQVFAFVSVFVLLLAIFSQYTIRKMKSCKPQKLEGEKLYTTKEGDQLGYVEAGRLESKCHYMKRVPALFFYFFF